MMDFVYNGIAASSFGLRVSSVDTYGAPERVVTEYQIPGPIPKIYVQDENKFTPYTRQFECAIMRDRDLESTTAAVKQWLMSDADYHKLDDTYQPDVYRLARFVGNFSTDWIGSSRRSISLPITFACQPQLWLKSGDTWHDVNISLGSLKLVNPTGNKSYPLIRFDFTGASDTSAQVLFSTDTVSGYIVCQAPTGSSSKIIYVDCETQDCWDADNNNKNASVMFSGDCSIAKNMMFRQTDFSNVHVSLKPRWWRL